MYTQTNSKEQMTINFNSFQSIPTIWNVKDNFCLDLLNLFSLWRSINQDTPTFGLLVISTQTRTNLISLIHTHLQTYPPSTLRHILFLSRFVVPRKLEVCPIPIFFNVSLLCVTRTLKGAMLIHLLNRKKERKKERKKSKKKNERKYFKNLCLLRHSPVVNGIPGSNVR